MTESNLLYAGLRDIGAARVCNSIAHALDLCRAGSFDCVLADFELPDGNGITLVNALKREQIAAPVILLLEPGREGVAGDALRAGAAEVVVADDGGGLIRLLDAVVPIVIERCKREQTCQADRLYLDNLMDQSADSIYFKDRERRMLRVSRKMARDLGCLEPVELIGRTDTELFGEVFGQRTRLDDQRVLETGTPLVGIVECRALPDDTQNWTSTTKWPLRDARGEIIGLMGITREINDLKKAEMDLEFLATHDALTRLPNRYLLTDRLEQMVARSARHRLTFATLFLDLDNFKCVNDTLGHPAGDSALQLVAERLSACIRKSDTMARWAGDEFVILLDAIHEPVQVRAVAEKILRQVALPIPLHGESVHLTASIGIGLYPEHGGGDGLIRAADHAMYLAKRQGKNRFVVFAGESHPMV